MPLSIAIVQAPESARLIAAPKHSPALDGLRGVAILAVFFSHFGGGHKSTNLIIHLWSIAADAGWMGVDLFFCLSGFLITGILYDSSSAAHRAKNFYARRALRIFPVFYGVLFGLLLLTPVLHLQWHAGHLMYFFYLSNMVPVVLPTLQSPGPRINLTHLWSLAVEEQFYLLWPFVIWIVQDRVKLLRISGLLVLIVLLVRTMLVLHGTDPFIIYSMLFTRADSLICGAILALLIRGPANLRPMVDIMLPISAVLMLVMFMIVGSGLHESPIINSVGFTIIAIFATCLVYCAYSGTHWIATIANHKTLRFVGRYSYGLYVYHGFLIAFLLPLVIPTEHLVHSIWLGGILFLTGCLALSLAVAMLSYHFFEEPILRLKRRFV